MTTQPPVTMQLQHMNVGQATPLKVGARAARSGIDKRPVVGPVKVDKLGLAGDHVLNTRHHGGPDQAAYLYTSADYDWWAAQGLAVRPGLFGENLTVGGPGSADFRVGDRLHLGAGPEGVILEITAPRIPCGTLAAHLGDPTFARRFAQARRPGLYARVLQPGTVQAGDPITLTPAALDGAPGIGELFELDLHGTFRGQPVTPDDLRRLLEHPLAERSRADLLKRLAKLEKRG
ncbi:MOSC domain-containing protein [Deinococcus aquaticus]|uniref:MOSC domain-containing protein n=1 Tax=Deinococcus aquaticus TaxID=328692 RepID=A0ABY7UZR8_9DEIO|nr:MOSC domain-containing protein [Deinococcus aquaticus]WDA58345.1 MOSC domain-containing protein [Deinococcus aquaticus]